MYRRAFGFLLLSLAFAFAAGCASEAPADESKKDPSYQVPANLNKDPHAPPLPGGKPVDLAVFEKAQADAEAALKKNPKDAKAKRDYVQATATLGTETMMSPDLPRREKYKKALVYYRAALKVDPKNEESKTNSKAIEDIYKSMNLPVPK